MEDSHHKSTISFAVVFIGQAFSLFGSRLVQFALVWWLTTVSGSASVLALASIMAILPQVLLGPFAGALVDRWNRRLILMISDTLIALAVLVLAFLYSQNSVQIWHIYVLMSLRSLGGAFQWPAMQASTSIMVPEKHLSRVSGLNQSFHGIANIVAPPLGALLLELTPIQNILAIDIFTAFLAVTPLFFIAIPQPLRGLLEGESKSIFSDLREGFKFVMGWRALLMIISMALVINLLTNPAFSLLPILVTNYFKGGAIELAWLQSSFGVGMIAGGMILGVWGGQTSRIRTALLSVVISGLAFLGFSFTPSNSLLLGIGLILISGLTNSIASASFFAILQSTVPPALQGRVFTLVMSLIMSMTPIGLAFAGPLSDLFGVRVWYSVAGIGMILMAGGLSFLSTVTNIEKESPNPESIS
jgi:DHA3 family macrolide efflux protein-like MFS transporter